MGYCETKYRDEQQLKHPDASSDKSVYTGQSSKIGCLSGIREICGLCCLAHIECLQMLDIRTLAHPRTKCSEIQITRPSIVSAHYFPRLSFPITRHFPGHVLPKPTSASSWTTKKEYRAVYRPRLVYRPERRICARHRQTPERETWLGNSISPSQYSASVAHSRGMISCTPPSVHAYFNIPGPRPTTSLAPSCVHPQSCIPIDAGKKLKYPDPNVAEVSSAKPNLDNIGCLTYSYRDRSRCALL